MIFDKLDNAKKYESIHPLFKEAFDYLLKTDFKKLENGKYLIKGEKLFALVERANGRDRSVAKLESHRKYIDIQLVLEGDEEMGHQTLSHCKNPIDAYNPDKDYIFYNDSALNWIKTPPNYFCIFFPEDAHAPLVGKGERFKVVVKVLVSGVA